MSLTYGPKTFDIKPASAAQVSVLSLPDKTPATLSQAVLVSNGSITFTVAVAGLYTIVIKDGQSSISDTVFLTDHPPYDITDPRSFTDAAVAAQKDDTAASTKIIMATPDIYPDIDNTGATNTAASLNTLVANAPQGATVTLRGDYLIDYWNIPASKFLILDLTAARIITRSGGSAVTCIGDFESQAVVTSITTETLVMEISTVTLTKLTMATAPAWKRGDIIKVIADDVIPAAHVTSDTTKPRVGQFATIYSVEGTVVYLHNSLTEPFTTNIRAARLIPGSVTILGGTFDVTDLRLANKVEGNMLRLQSLIEPKVIGASMPRLVGMGVSMKSCFGYTVDGLTTVTGVNNTDLGVLAYSVHDSSCIDGVVINGKFRGGRHGFTDGTGLVPVGSTDTASYGATMNFSVENNTVRDMTAACLDTHHMSYGGRFKNNTTYPVPEEYGYLLRGRNHRIDSPVNHGGLGVVSILNQSTGSWSQGESYGHEMVNARSFGTERVATVTSHADGNHPKFGQRDKYNLVVHGGYHEGLRRISVQINSEVRFEGKGVFRFGSLANGAFYEVQNSIIKVDRADLDATMITSISQFGTQRVLYANDATSAQHSIIRIDDLRIAASSTYIDASVNPFYATANTEKFKAKVEFETPWPTTNPFDIPEAVPTSLQWSCTYDPNNSTSRNSSSGVSLSNAALAGSIERLTRATNQQLVLTANITDSVARTMIALPPGKYDGQQLTIIMGSATAGLTIPHGASFNTRLLGSTNKTISTGNAMCRLQWSLGAWRE